jgi:hypothetical protein
MELDLIFKPNSEVFSILNFFTKPGIVKFKRLKNWAHTHTQKTYNKTSNVKTITTSSHKKEKLVNCKIIYLENQIDYTKVTPNLFESFTKRSTCNNKRKIRSIYLHMSKHQIPK